MSTSLLETFCVIIFPYISWERQMCLPLFTNSRGMAKKTKIYVKSVYYMLTPNALLHSMQPIELTVNLNVTIYKCHQSQLNCELFAEATNLWQMQILQVVACQCWVSWKCSSVERFLLQILADRQLQKTIQLSLKLELILIILTFYDDKINLWD